MAPAPATQAALGRRRGETPPTKVPPKNAASSTEAGRGWVWSRMRHTTSESEPEASTNGTPARSTSIQVSTAAIIPTGTTAQCASSVMCSGMSRCERSSPNMSAIRYTTDPEMKATLPMRPPTPSQTDGPMSDQSTPQMTAAAMTSHDDCVTYCGRSPTQVPA